MLGKLLLDFTFGAAVCCSYGADEMLFSRKMMMRMPKPQGVSGLFELLMLLTRLILLLENDKAHVFFGVPHLIKRNNRLSVQLPINAPDSQTSGDIFVPLGDIKLQLSSKFAGRF